MGSSRALLCTTAFVLFFLSSASKDEQRDVTFDLDKVMQEMQQPESFILQKAVLPDLLDFKGELGIEPRSVGGPPSENYPVKFPLAMPSSDNLQAICLNADYRPHYPESYFPASGFGQLRRRASFVNKAESLFSVCCKGNETRGSEATLCCATKAWELSVKSFCKEDTSVKDRIYECCRQKGGERLNCFHNDAPNPSYEPTEELPVPQPSSAPNVNFDPKNCWTGTTRANLKVKKNGKKPSTSKKVDISFPLGRPTADSIESLCQNQKARPLYNVKCLPSSGYEWLARQAKTLNRIEKQFKQCCKKKKDVLRCADNKWREELDKFCVDENGQEVDFQCCAASQGSNDRFDCFHNVSPDAHYNMTEELTLSQICKTHKIIKKKFPVPLPLKTLVNQCCSQSDDQKTACIVQGIEGMSANLCLSKKVSPAVRRCCRPSSQEAPQCISKILMDAVTKAASVLRQKKKKKCPFS